MAAGKRAIDEHASLIDLVVEVRDARLPGATAVAALHPKLRAKPRVTLLNREDMADPAATSAWLRRLRPGGPAYATIGINAASLRGVRETILSAPRKRATLHVAVVGAPNTGKSSVINALARRKRAVAQDRAGVTRHVRWLALAPGVELLDTPGVLPPKIIDRDAAWRLAAIGCLPESAYDPEDVVERMGAWLRAAGLDAAAARVDLKASARARGMLRKGGEVDRAAAARALLTQFRSGSLGRFTFELPGEDA
jgi:ribosome biogenesis GTPase A